ncbi:MAG: ATP-binding protein [Armatimonadetes bacterium]|nr:ATP-binding protein [Armatimonadota bacterium]
MHFGNHIWYQLLCLSSAALSVGLMWRILRRGAPGNKPAAAFMGCAALWSLGAAGEYGCTSPAQANIWYAIAAPGKALGPLFLFLMVLEYLRYHTLVTHRAVAYFAVVPVLTVLARWTDPWLGLYYAHTPPPGAFQAATYTPLGWLMLGYSLVIAFAGHTLLLLHIALAPTGHRRQISLFLIGALMPVAGAALYMLDVGPFAVYDLTPPLLNFAGLMLSLGMVKHRLFRMTPLLHQIVAASLKDGILILDDSGTAIECNSAARRLLDWSDGDVVGKHWPASAPDWYREAMPAAQAEMWDVTHDGVTLQVSTTPCPAPHTDETIITLRDVTAERAMVEEKARRAMARYLHDDIGQSISACLLHLAALKRQGVTPSQADQIQAIAGGLEHTLRRSRAVTLEITPALHCDEGVSPMLRWLAANMQRAFGVAIRVDADRSVPDLDAEGCRRLFGMVRELLFNAVKHSRAREVMVTVAAEEGRRLITVTDNGVGIDAGASEPAGMGLATIRAELSTLGGDLVVAPSPAGGTSACIVWPLDPQPAQ